MDAALSDVLTCPRCGPTYGLVLLPHEVVERRVRSGVLGCANCRERWEIEDGVADLRVERGPGPEGEGGPAHTAAAVRLAGLMGLAEARGTVLVAGPAAAAAPELAELVEGVEVMAAGWPGGATPESPRVSRLRLSGVLPVRSGSLRGVALTGGWSALVEEGARVLGREGHLVLDPAPGEARARVEAAGLAVLAEESGVVVAGRPA